MTKQKLSARQARWAKLLSWYYFKIQYRPRHKNAKADAFSRKEEDVNIQNRLKNKSRYQIMLLADKVAVRTKLASINSLTLID
jgi:hypothetical protein